MNEIRYSLIYEISQPAFILVLFIQQVHVLICIILHPAFHSLIIRVSYLKCPEMPFCLMLSCFYPLSSNSRPCPPFIYDLKKFSSLQLLTRPKLCETDESFLPILLSHLLYYLVTLCIIMLCFNIFHNTS